MRILSLIPASTEIVCALGASDQLVGRSHECDFPPSVQSLPVCSAPKYEPDGTCYQINERIIALLQEGLSIYRLDAAQLDALAPDVILTQTQCDVCAVNLKEVEAAVCQMVSSRPKIVALAPNSLGDVYGDILKIAEALGLAEAGETLVESMRRQMAEIAARVPKKSRPPKILCLEWLDPLMAGGNWLPQLTSMLAADHLFGEAGAHSPWLKPQELAACDPDHLLMIPCGYDIATTRKALPGTLQQPALRELRAVREGRIYLADGNQFFNRPGPRLVASLEILAEILYPEEFEFGHRGSGWVCYQADDDNNQSLS